MKTAVDTAKSLGILLDDLLLSLRSTPIGPHLPSLQEILHNRTQDCPGQPSHPVDFEEIRDNLITQMLVQKKCHDHRHNARDLPELHPGQPVLFFNHADANSYKEGTITGPATTPRGYRLEAQGRVFHCTRQHTCPLDIDTTPFPRPSTHQGSLISGPSTYKDSPITRPSSRTQPQIDNPQQQSLVKPSKQSCIPTLQV